MPNNPISIRTAILASVALILVSVGWFLYQAQSRFTKTIEALQQISVPNNSPAASKAVQQVTQMRAPFMLQPAAAPPQSAPQTSVSQQTPSSTQSALESVQQSVPNISQQAVAPQMMPQAPATFDLGRIREMAKENDRNSAAIQQQLQYYSQRPSTLQTEVNRNLDSTTETLRLQADRREQENARLRLQLGQ
jgi:hypothetical protein